MDSHNPLLLSLESTLDGAYALLQRQSFNEAFRLLGDEMSSLHDQAVLSDSVEKARELVRAHPLFELCHEDPYTARAFSKPRGYAGDAVMLDYVYAGTPPDDTTQMGGGVFSQTTGGPMGLSVRFRRQLLTSYINDTIVRNPSACILSVASGHCRELEGSHALHADYKGVFTTFDQDKESCAEVDGRYGHKVDAQIGDVKRLIMGKCDLGSYDLIYSAGLYDYLPATVAERLSSTLGEMLRPGGRLITANFAQGSHGRGYLDWVMDWRLLYRSLDEFRTVSSWASERAALFTDPHDNVIYSVTRAS